MAARSTLLKKVTRFVAAAFVGLVVLGIAVASIGRISVEQDERQQAIASGATGLSFGGQVVPASQFKVGSRVKWPFIVEGYYAVPFDIHASVHIKTYLVLPWGKYVLSSQVVHPL